MYNAATRLPVRLCALLLLAAAPLAAQTIKTYAGGGAGDGQAATAVPLYDPFAAAVDRNGNLYFSERDGNRVRRVDAATGKISTVAGNGGKGFTGDGGPATAAALSDPTGLAFDGNGNLFVADADNGRVRRVDAATGVITTVAGGGTPADGLGDGGPATSAAFGSPWGLAFDKGGDLYIGDLQTSRVRRLSHTTGVITTVAGGGAQGFGGDGGPATAASLERPLALAFDGPGSLYIADATNNRVRKVDAKGTISTFAGNGSSDFGGDGGAATAASIFYPTALAFDGSGHLIVADTFHRRVRSVDPATGVITTVFGNGDYGGGDGNPATQAGLVEPRGLAFDASGTLYVTDSPVRKVAPGTTIVSTVAGGGSFLGDDGPATSALLYFPGGIAADSSGNLFVADYVNNRVRRIAATTKTITTVAGNGGLYFDSDGRAATATPIGFPRSVALDAAGNLYIGDPFNDLVYRVDAATGLLKLVAGGGPANAVGDGGPATSAYVVPDGLALDGTGNLYISDRAHHRVRKVDGRSGTITTVAGIDTTDNGGGFSGDGGPATAARLSFPNGLAFDGAGNLFIADSGNDAVRKIATATGTITTTAGRGNPSDGVGDGNLATAAVVSGPLQVAFDRSGNLLITESNRVRKVDHATTIITTLAGGDAGFQGDGGAPAAARLSTPRGVAVNAAGDVFISDSLNNRIRVVSASGGCPPPTITTPPAGQTVVTGQAAVLVVAAAGTGTLTYQWYQGATGDVTRPVAGAASASFTTPPLAATTVYWVRVKDSCGQADSSAATITVASNLADLSLQMASSADIVAVGSSVTFTLTARNNGPTTATAVTVTDTAPAGATLVSSASSLGSCSGTAPVVCVAGSLVPGAAVTVTLVFTPQQSGVLTNRARVDATEPDPNLNDNTAAYDVNVASADSADLYVWSSDSPDPVRVGQPLTYTFFVGNAGPAPASGISLVNTLPAGVTLASVDSLQGSCSGAGPITCALGSLLPGGSTTVTIVVTPTAVGTLADGATVTAAQADPVSWNNSSSETTTVLSNQAACPAQAPTILSAPDGIVRAGDTFTVSWSDVYGPTDPAGSYLVELATAADFASGTVLKSVTTRNLNLSFPTQAGTNATLYFRVTSVAGCGVPGGVSPAVAVNVAPNPPSIVVTAPQDPPWVVRPNDAPPAATVRFKNIGGAPAAVQFRAVSDAAFFTFSPTTAVVAPGQEVTVTITALAGATARTGTSSGALVADTVQGSVSESVVLSVTDTFAADGRATVDQDEVLIVDRPAAPRRRGAADALPTVRVSNDGKTPIFLVPSVGPGGAWLRLDPNDFATPLGPGETRTISLATDGTRLSASDYPLPIWTILSVKAAGGAAETDVKIYFQAGTTVTPAVGRGFLSSGESSFIVPTSVHKTGAGGTLFTSDGWIRNLSPDPALLDLYVTPSGQDGQSNAVKVQQSIPGFGTLRLFDFVQGLFGSTDTAGPVEVRSSDFSQLSVRVSASGLPGSGDITSRYGTEIPVYGSGTGTGVGRPSLVLTGIKSTAAYRLNIILAETIGTSAKVTLRLYDSAGALLASKPVTVPAAGNTQFPLLDTLGLTGREVEAGSLVVEPASGSGRVVAIGTLIDNASASFQSLSGRAFRETTASAGRGPAPLASAPLPHVIPSIVHSHGIGAFFTTEVSVTNPTATPAPLHFVYDYTGSDTAGNPFSGSATADITIGARASLPAEKSRDAVVNLFGLPAGSNTAGPMRIEGTGASLIVARATVTTPVDLLTPAKGSKGSEFQSYSATSAEAVSLATTPVAIYPGIQKYPGIRTNLILAEVSGKPATVRVRLVNGTSGGVIAQLDRALGPFERVQINDIWNGAGGFGVGNAPFDRVSVSLEPTGTAAGAVVGALSVIDNVTNSSRILALQPPGPPQPSWIGF